MTNDRLLSFAAVGRIFGVSAKTVGKWVDAKVLRPSQPTPEGRRFIFESEVARLRIELLEQQEGEIE